MASESSERLNMPDGMDRFTATGRPFKASTERDKASAAFTSVMASDTGGIAGVNHLPVKFTDDSLIPVAVLPPNSSAPAETSKKQWFWSRRRSENSNFIMKKMPRRDYLKHYAKDDNGRYCGTEAPAEDCILRGEDVGKYRPHSLTFRNEMGGTSSKKDNVVR
ncbi:uncharacterized protein HMPREF1541_08591 [Cyphellophora europaea CBS 101466]|uniref:Uncharacterized protein n=1 Tax=Cyphellophora europaea (strain CBS 101466) TaxID=1220924 RepID=W2RKQ5_CYPE1|nr:uncharacterized protein HMPREF1541_08591 [Cyphellophora europaea CBS 101466]ETN36314.1 hypothetical protein HMPREF1541_08591 [Cyphellophora europaea CBS 101466]